LKSSSVRWASRKKRAEKAMRGVQKRRSAVGAERDTGAAKQSRAAA
jgi:hypothetical protein